MSHAVANQHVEFVLVILDGQHHRHRLTDLDDTADFRSPGTFANLDLHPALKVITEEVGRDGVEHINGEWTEGDRLFVVIVPIF